jgi:hypothetical protein
VILKTRAYGIFISTLNFWVEQPILWQSRLVIVINTKIILLMKAGGEIGKTFSPGKTILAIQYKLICDPQSKSHYINKN